MGKMKQVAMDAAQKDLGMQVDKFLDDEYQYKCYLEKLELQRHFPVSNCCESKICYSLQLNENICTQCHNICEAV